MTRSWKGFLLGGLVGGISGFIFMFGIDFVRFLMNYYPD